MKTLQSKVFVFIKNIIFLSVLSGFIFSISGCGDFVTETDTGACSNALDGRDYDTALSSCTSRKDKATAFMGKAGYDILCKIPEYINNRAVTIADAKRGDIGNSSKYYAEAIFQTLNYNAITISPYMGEDSIKPFCEYSDKGVFILCLTSNSGSNNFQNKKINDKELYIHVAELAVKMNVNDNIGLVVGATKSEQMKIIKEYSFNLPWLIPGVGFQGGSLENSILIGSKNKSTPIINVSRGIIYAGNGSINDIIIATEEYTKKIRSIL